MLQFSASLSLVLWSGAIEPLRPCGAIRAIHVEDIYMLFVVQHSPEDKDHHPRKVREHDPSHFLVVDQVSQHEKNCTTAEGDVDESTGQKDEEIPGHDPHGRQSCQTGSH